MKWLTWPGRLVAEVWATFKGNPRLYALFLAGPFTLGAMMVVLREAWDMRWKQPLEQLDILKWAVMMLGFTHLIVVVALAAVRVSGSGPGGFSFNVDADEEQAPPQQVTAHVEGEIRATVETDDGELPPEQRVKR